MATPTDNREATRPYIVPMGLTPRDEWIQGYAAALAVSHPEMTARQRFVAACQAYRDAETGKK